MNAFFQEPPQLSNTYLNDILLQRTMLRYLGPAGLKHIEPDLSRMGDLAAGEMYSLAQRCRLEEPVHIPIDPWGHPVHTIHVARSWERYAEIAAEMGLVAIPYGSGQHRRIHQMALVYLFAPSSQVYTCPLAMTDGCAQSLTLLAQNNPSAASLAEDVLPRLIHRDPQQAWTSGQWMTERTGGSDVGLTQTTAQCIDGIWYLTGNKWFTSAVTANVALTLARPVGNPEGGKGLALFLVQLRDKNGFLQNIHVSRLKDKLGTRHVPTAELELDGTPAMLVAEPHNGVRNMSHMLNVTRLWNAICSISSMRRGLDLANDYAKKRVAFGAPLCEKPLHRETLDDLEAQWEGAFHLAFFAADQLEQLNAGDLPPAHAAAVRAIMPLTKLLTGKMAVSHASEVLECFGGAGYIEDTGLPELLRDAQVLPIWEGTTNVLSLELLRGLTTAGGMETLVSMIKQRLAPFAHTPFASICETWLACACAWWNTTASHPAKREAHARRFAMHLGHSLMMACMLEHASWETDRLMRDRTLANATRLAERGAGPQP